MYLESTTNKGNQNNITNYFNKDNITQSIEYKEFDNNFLNFNLSFEENFNSNQKLSNNKSKEEIYNKFIDFENDKDEENEEIKSILSDLNKNIDINIKEKENNNYRECQEIINILRKPLSDKYIRSYISPFKPLLKPKKISMAGKVLYDIQNDNNDDNTNNTSTQNFSNASDVNHHI